MQYRIKIYTRTPTDDYTDGLANSVHFALCGDGDEPIPLNKNYGMLFASAVIDERNVIIEKGLKNPQIFQIDDKTFGIAAVRVNQDGEEDTTCTGKFLLWTTEDFIGFNEHGLIEQNNDWLSNLKSACEEIAINVESVERIKGHYFPKFIKSTAETFSFPLAVGYADPVIFRWEGKYYFTATNDNVDAVGLFVREAETVEGLFAEGYKEYLILEYNEEKGFVQTFWAPEFHIIGGCVYILFAVGGKKWSPQSHIMKLKKGGKIINPGDWEEPARVKKADGSFLAEITEGEITLDMTYFNADGKHYYCWSYRKYLPFDTGSMLYIAEIDCKTPWVLKSEPVLLSRPLLGWENHQGTINNEGAYPLVTDDRVILAYSGGAAGGYTYAIGTLTIKRGGDYLNPNEWKKSHYPIMSYYSFEGEYGPGHNSFYCDDDGNIMNVYHAQQEIGRVKRCIAIRPVCLNENGFYVL